MNVILLKVKCQLLLYYGVTLKYCFILYFSLNKPSKPFSNEITNIKQDVLIKKVILLRRNSYQRVVRKLSLLESCPYLRVVLSTEVSLLEMYPYETCVLIKEVD